MKNKEHYFYMGYIISRAGINSSGVRWCALGDGIVFKADTLAGIKRLIKESLPS